MITGGIPFSMTTRISRPRRPGAAVLNGREIAEPPRPLMMTVDSGGITTKAAGGQRDTTGNGGDSWAGTTPPGTIGAAGVDPTSGQTAAPGSANAAQDSAGAAASASTTTGAIPAIPAAPGVGGPVAGAAAPSGAAAGDGAHKATPGGGTGAGLGGGSGA